MGDLLQIGQVAVEKGAANGQEVGVTRVFDLYNTPGILPGTHLLAIDLNQLVGTNNSEWHETPQLGILLHGIFVVFLDVVGEVVNRDAVVLDILHDQLLRFGQFGGGEGVGLADDGDDVDTGRQALHQLDVELTETVTGGCDEVKEDMDTVVPEAGVTLDPRLLGKNIIVLALEVSNNFPEAAKRSVVH